MALIVGTNSYISVVDATTYFNDSLSSGDWAGVDPDTQSQSLITATRMLDRATWQGSKTVAAQALQWPRTGVTDRYSNPVDSVAVPPQVINATCELALAIVLDPTVQTVKNQNSNIKTIKAGPAEVTFMRPVVAGRFPTIIQELIGQFLSAAKNIATPIVTGNCDSSHFDPSDPRYNYDIIRGFS